MTKLRLIVTDKCPKACPGCCNNHKTGKSRKKLKNILSFDDSSAFQINSNKYSSKARDFYELIITGGEPMMFPKKIIELVSQVSKYSSKYLYTSTYDPKWMAIILKVINGVVITIHDDEDWDRLKELNYILRTDAVKDILEHKSLRLNVFKTKTFPVIDLSLWKVKFMEWIVDCPLPENEELYELKNKW